MKRWIYKGLVLVLFFLHKTNSQDFVVKCTTDPITIMATTASLNALGVSGSTNHIYISRSVVGNPKSLPTTCRKLRSSAIASPFSLKPTVCEPYITMNSTYLFVTWTFRNGLSIGTTVARYSENCVNVSCAYNRTQLVTSSAISPTLQRLLIGAVNAQGGFSTSLTLFRDAAFSNQLTAGSTVMVTSYIFVRAAITTTPVLSSRFIVQMRKCWATTTSSPISSPSYALITASCSADSTYITIIRNYQPQNGTFNVSAFIWTSNAALPIYIHCDISVCDNQASGANCTGPTCSARKRRDIDTENRIISYGPIHIVSDTLSNKCSQNNGGCSDICSTKNDGVVCSCPIGSILSEDKKTCFVISQGYLEKISINSNNPLFIAALFMVVLALLMSFVFFISRRRTTVKAIDQFVN